VKSKFQQITRGGRRNPLAGIEVLWIEDDVVPVTSITYFVVIPSRGLRCFGCSSRGRRGAGYTVVCRNPLAGIEVLWIEPAAQRAKKYLDT
jgi:hypothetical protein